MFVWTWGAGERESGKGYPRWMGRRSQLQDAAEVLSPGALRSMGPSKQGSLSLELGCKLEAPKGQPSALQ